MTIHAAVTAPGTVINLVNFLTPPDNSLGVTYVPTAGNPNAQVGGTYVNGIFTPPGATSPVVLIATAALTSAQLLALATSSVPIIPTPGASLYIQPWDYVLELVFGGTAYATAANTNACYLGYQSPFPSSAVNYAMLFTWGGPTLATSFVETTATSIATGPCGNAPITLSAITNQPLYFGAPHSLTAGNGTLKVTVTYSILAA
jgi:hypothetical protein